MRILVLVFLPFLALAQTQPWELKVDDSLWEKVASGGTADFLIILTEQADISKAQGFSEKNEKGQFVFETLREVAIRTQGPLEDMLIQAGANYQSFYLVNGLWARGDANLIQALAERPEVARLEDNPVVSISLPETDPFLLEERSLIPWGLTKINAPAAWALGYEGQGVVVGGQDTGYEWEHPALKNQYRGWNGSAVDHNYNWHDAIDSLINGGSNSCGLNLLAPCDDFGHGTHTMGTMAGTPHPDTIIGVAPEAKWIGCRCMEEGDGTPATYIECFEWLLAPTNINGQNPNPAMAPHVINNSWYCPASEGCNSSNYATMEMAINNLRAAGIVVVVSAGNTGPACSSLNFPPAMYTGSFTVGATNSSDVIASFSSRGPVTVYGNHSKPDVSAPGVSVYSANGVDNNPGYFSYATLSGTSMAGPHVAGTVALMISAKPDLAGNVDIIESLLETTAIPLYPVAPFCGGDNASSLPNNVYGHGRIDAFAAVNAALALPVDWLYFEAERQEKTVHLTWGTARESGCEAFEIQRSVDGQSWQAIGSTPCRGPGDYQYIDAGPFPGWNYYRLRQIDVDGSYSFSKVEGVEIPAEIPAWQLLVRPAESLVLVNLPGWNHPCFFEIYASDGRLLHHARLEGSQGVAVPYLPKGVYAMLLRSMTGEVLGVQRVVW